MDEGDDDFVEAVMDATAGWGYCSFFGLDGSDDAHYLAGFGGLVFLPAAVATGDKESVVVGFTDGCEAVDDEAGFPAAGYDIAGD
jgi:hypothetical protein